MPSAFFAGTTDPVTRKLKTRQWILEFASWWARIQSIRESIRDIGKIQALISIGCQIFKDRQNVTKNVFRAASSLNYLQIIKVSTGWIQGSL